MSFEECTDTMHNAHVSACWQLERRTCESSSPTPDSAVTDWHTCRERKQGLPLQWIEFSFILPRQALNPARLAVLTLFSLISVLFFCTSVRFAQYYNCLAENSGVELLAEKCCLLTEFNNVAQLMMPERTYFMPRTTYGHTDVANAFLCAALVSAVWRIVSRLNTRIFGSGISPGRGLSFTDNTHDVTFDPVLRIIWSVTGIGKSMGAWINHGLSPASRSGFWPRAGGGTWICVGLLLLFLYTGPAQGAAVSTPSPHNAGKIFALLFRASVYLPACLSCVSIVSRPVCVFLYLFKCLSLLSVYLLACLLSLPLSPSLSLCLSRNCSFDAPSSGAQPASVIDLGVCPSLDARQLQWRTVAAVGWRNIKMSLRDTFVWEQRQKELERPLPPSDSRVVTLTGCPHWRREGIRPELSGRIEMCGNSSTQLGTNFNSSLMWMGLHGGWEGGDHPCWWGPWAALLWSWWDIFWCTMGKPPPHNFSSW